MLIMKQLLLLLFVSALWLPLSARAEASPPTPAVPSIAVRMVHPDSQELDREGKPAPAGYTPYVYEFRDRRGKMHQEGLFLKDAPVITEAEVERAGFPCVRVPCTRDRWTSIDATRRLLRHVVIHARSSEKTYLPGMKEGYLSGVDALSHYKTAPPGTNGTLKTAPLHDVCSHAADALRVFSEAHEGGYITKQLGWRNDEQEKISSCKCLAKGAETLW